MNSGYILEGTFEEFGEFHERSREGLLKTPGGIPVIILERIRGRGKESWKIIQQESREESSLKSQEEFLEKFREEF